MTKLWLQGSAIPHDNMGDGVFIKVYRRSSPIGDENDSTQIIMKNGSFFTFSVQMWLAMQISSLKPIKSRGNRLFEMTNRSTKYKCAFLVSSLVI